MRKIHIGIGDTYECKRHGTLSVLPCAWPGCKNGVSDDQFQEEPFYDKKNPTVYTRREWPSPLGDSYYSWESSRLPNWFGSPIIFWNEARRHKLLPDPFPEVVYHYTSLEGFLGIIDTKSIWLSDYSYLNDHKELIYGTDKAIEIICEMKDAESNPDIVALFSTWLKKLQSLPNRICISSFSSESDSLSQWRAYGPLAIGFSTRDLALHVNQSRLQPVIYNPKDQEKLVKIYLHHLKNAYLVDISSNRLERIPDVYHTIERILELIVFFKDPAFKSENEYRLVFIDLPDLYEEMGEQKLSKSFRISNGKIIPYVKSTDILPSDNRKFDLNITEIVLGPESDTLLERGVREFLDEKGLADVKICRSIVPLRT